MKKIGIIIILIFSSIICSAQTIRYTMPFGLTAYSFYAVLNIHDKTDAATVVYNGNLSVRATAGNRLVRATISISSSSANPLVYFEVKNNISSVGAAIGVSVNGLSYIFSLGSDAFGWAYQSYISTGLKYHNNVQTAYGTGYGISDVIMVAVDMTNGFIYFGKNGTWLNSGDPTSGATGTGACFSGLTGNVFPTLGNYSGNGYDYTVNFGASSFTYTPPAGYAGLHH